MLDDAAEVMVQGAGFEPAKHYAPELKSGPFDQLGYPCKSAGKAIGLETSGTQRPLLGAHGENDALSARTSRTL